MVNKKFSLSCSRNQWIATAIVLLIVSISIGVISSDVRAGSAGLRDATPPVKTGQWHQTLRDRLKTAEELYDETLELNISYECILAVCSKREGEEWAQLRDDLSQGLFKPVVDLSTDIAFAWNFILEKVQNGEIDESSIEGLLQTVDLKLKESRERVAQLTTTRNELLVKAQVLLGKDKAEASKSLDWGHPIRDRLKKKTAQVLDED
ncbi:MAG: hypothetical protein KDA29_00690 [Phycisphaerales bacterium]|nr:hypothetical protein [Phycisphaerales bacterium]